MGLDLAVERADDDELRFTEWLLTKILGDDAATGKDGEPAWGEGVARDRMMSWTHPEMLHGHKSASSRCNGDRIQVAEDPETELMTEIDVTDARAPDRNSVLRTVDRVEEHLQVKVVGVTADTAYGEADNRVACLKRGIDLVSRVPIPVDPEVDNLPFQLDEPAGMLTCPRGRSVSVPREVKDPSGQMVKQFAFARETRVGCQFFDGCVRSEDDALKVTLNYHQDMPRVAGQRQETDEFRKASGSGRRSSVRSRSWWARS